ncbi:hypothetical protein ACA910_005218 [Epithemia clementina (nom. ined.)]
MTEPKRESTAVAAPQFALPLLQEVEGPTRLPPMELLDSVQLLQRYLWSVRQHQERQRLQSTTHHLLENEHPGNLPHSSTGPATDSFGPGIGRQSNNNDDRKKKTKMNDILIDQILQVVDTLFGATSTAAVPSSSSSSSPSSSLVEDAMSILDTAESSITRVVSMSSQRSLFLVRNSSQGGNNHFGGNSTRHGFDNNSISATLLPPRQGQDQQQQQQHHHHHHPALQRHSNPNFGQVHDRHDPPRARESTAAPSTAATRSSDHPLYYFCLLPDTEKGNCQENDNYYYCSCQSHYENTVQAFHVQPPLADQNDDDDQGITQEEAAAHYSTATRQNVLCQHLLALLLVPALGIQTAVLEMSNDREFAELILGRIGL